MIDDITAARFWSKVDKRGPDECWPWTGTRVRAGYGRIRIGDAQRPTAQVAWEIEHGEPFPRGLIACHSCDNPPCSNQAHIWPGTHRQNYEDCVAKGRAAGFGASNAKKEFCANGHPLSGDNLILKATSKCTARICRACQRNYHLKWRLENRPVVTKPQLTEDQRAEIRASSENTRDLVLRFGIDRSWVKRIRKAAAFLQSNRQGEG